MSSRRLTISSVTHIAVGAGFVIALATSDLTRSWKGVGIGVSTAVVLLAVVLEISEYASERAAAYRSAPKINAFMYRWISQPGRVAIFSHNMSWVSDEVDFGLRGLYYAIARKDRPTVRQLLLERAADGDLLVCVPRQTPLTEELARAGAEVVTYEDLHFVPQGRFTIVRYGRADSAVAIGRSDSRVHRIQTFPKGQHPAFALAEDLVELVKRHRTLVEAEER